MKSFLKLISKNVTFPNGVVTFFLVCLDKEYQNEVGHENTWTEYGC